MERVITGYRCDEVEDWVAELGCGHNQHVRHRPPFQWREWALCPDGRAARLGTPLDCPLCDRAELPDALRWVRATPVWDEGTMPTGLRRAHRLAPSTWARLVVHDGKLRFAAATSPAIDVELGAGTTQAIPPEVDHEVEPLGPVRFSVGFFTVDRAAQPAATRWTAPAAPAEEGGDPACWAGLLCPECGAVVEGGYHRPGCRGAQAGP